MRGVDPSIRGFGARSRGLGGEKQRQEDLQMPPSLPAVSTRPRQARPRALGRVLSLPSEQRGARDWGKFYVFLEIRLGPRSSFSRNVPKGLRVLVENHRTTSLGLATAIGRNREIQAQE